MVDSVFEKIVPFFKSRQTEAKVSPSIKISYDSYSYNADIKEALKNQWEQLQEELKKNPSVIKDSKSNKYQTGRIQQDLTLEIEGVVMEVEGPYYPDPLYKEPPPPPYQTPERQGNEVLDQFMAQNYNFVWALTHCSDDKFNALIEYLKATRRSGLKP